MIPLSIIITALASVSTLAHELSRLIEPFEKPVAQIKKFKIRFASWRIGKLAHSPAIGYVFRLNQTNFKSFFFTHKIYQRVLIIYVCVLYPIIL